MSSRAHLRVIDCRRSADPSIGSVLRVLLSMALKGELAGLLISYKLRNGDERFLSAGSYHSRPDAAAASALRMAHCYADQE